MRDGLGRTRRRWRRGALPQPTVGCVSSGWEGENRQRGVIGRRNRGDRDSIGGGGGSMGCCPSARASPRVATQVEATLRRHGGCQGGKKWWRWSSGGRRGSFGGRCGTEAMAEGRGGLDLELTARTPRAGGAKIAHGGVAMTVVGKRLQASGHCQRRGLKVLIPQGGPRTEKGGRRRRRKTRKNEGGGLLRWSEAADGGGGSSRRSRRRRGLRLREARAIFLGLGLGLGLGHAHKPQYKYTR